jgi:hypothetical protein
MEIGTPTQALEKIGRRLPKTRTIGFRVTEPEYLALETEAWKTGKTVADWTRDQVLVRLEFQGSGCRDERVFTELVGVELLLMNALGPLLRGERLSQSQLEALWKQVQTTKGRKAQELLIKRTNREEKQP